MKILILVLTLTSAITSFSQTTAPASPKVEQKPTYRWLDTTKQIDGETHVQLRKNYSIRLPNPKIIFDFKKYVGADKDLTIARQMFKDFFQTYFDAYEEEYLKSSMIPKEFSPLERVLLVTLEKVNRASLKDLSNPVNPPIEFNMALHSNLVNFEGSAESLLVKEIVKLRQQNKIMARIISELVKKPK